MPMLNAESCLSSYVSRRAENEYDSRRGLSAGRPLSTRGLRSRTPCSPNFPDLEFAGFSLLVGVGFPRDLPLHNGQAFGTGVSCRAVAMLQALFEDLGGQFFHPAVHAPQAVSGGFLRIPGIVAEQGFFEDGQAIFLHPRQIMSRHPGGRDIV